MKGYRSFLVLLTGLMMAIAAGSATAATVPETAADNDMDPCFNDDGWLNTVGSYDCITSAGFAAHTYLTPPDGNNYGGGTQFGGVPGTQETIAKTYTNLVAGQTYAVEWYIMTDLVQGAGSSAEAWFDVTLCSDQQETFRLTPGQRRTWFQQRLFFTADAASCNLRFTARNTGGDNSSWIFLDSVSIRASASSDLAITKSGPPTMSASGGIGSYTINVMNNGPEATNDTVEVIDTLPAGVTVNGGGAAAVLLGGPNPGDWNCTSDAGAPQMISCTSAAVFVNGQSSTFDFTADFASGTEGVVVSNTATVQPTFGSGTEDPNGTNDSASAVTTYGPAGQPQLTITPDALNFGESGVATVTALNSGSADLVLSDISGLALPFELSGGSCLPTPTTLAPGANCTIEVLFEGGVVGGGTLSGSFTITSNAPSSPDAVAVQGVPGGPVAIPTLDRSGLIVMLLLMMMAGGWMIRRQV